LAVSDERVEDDREEPEADDRGEGLGRGPERVDGEESEHDRCRKGQPRAMPSTALDGRGSGRCIIRNELNRPRSAANNGISRSICRSPV